MSQPGDEPGRWKRRVQLAMLPAGFLVFGLWAASTAIAIAAGGLDGWWAAVPFLGLGTSLVLIGAGYGFRRELRD